MAVLSKLGAGSFGMLFGVVVFTEWTIYATASYVFSAATLAQVPWPADINVISYLLKALLGIQAQQHPFIGIIPGILLGMSGGWIFGNVYNLLAKRLNYGIRMEFSNGGTSLDQFGVISYARVRGWATLLIYGAWIPLVGAAGATAGSLSASPASNTVSVIGTTAVVTSALSFLSGMVFASAFNSAAGLLGGIGIKLNREYEDTYTLKKISVLAAAGVMTMGYTISIASLMLIRGLMVDTGILGSLAIYLPQLELSSILISPILGLALGLTVVIFYNYVVARFYGLRLVLDGMDMEIAMEKNREATELENEKYKESLKMDRSKEMEPDIK
jgi:hypothetical protein